MGEGDGSGDDIGEGLFGPPGNALRLSLAAGLKVYGDWLPQAPAYGCWASGDGNCGDPEPP